MEKEFGWRETGQEGCTGPTIEALWSDSEGKVRTLRR